MTAPHPQYPIQGASTSNHISIQVNTTCDLEHTKMREDTPPQSPLLALPLELRQAIYAHLLPHGIHLTLLNEQPHLSTCVQPDPNHGQWGQERCDAASIMRPHSDPDPVWARRLQSTWGPHWECEEMVQGGHGLGFMRTCRAM
jgi:hypothetical protein